jgi:putative membrane protein
MTLFSQAEARRIANAITEAERSTSGEIVAVVAAESSTYLYVPFVWASAIALLPPSRSRQLAWIPACAGMTVWFGSGASFC